MRRVLWVVGVVVVLLATVLIVGMLLPRQHTVTETRTVAGDPERVWAVITAVEDFPSWRGDVDRVEVLSERQGDKTWSEHSSSGPMTYRVTESTPFHRWTVEIADEDLGFGGTWTWELVARPPSTVITLTEQGEVHNPFLRFVSHFFMDEQETITRYLDALESRMAEGG